MLDPLQYFGRSNDFGLSHTRIFHCKACDFHINFSCGWHKHGTFFMFDSLFFHRNSTGLRCSIVGYDNIFIQINKATGASRTDGIVMSFTKRFTACFNAPSLEVCSFMELFLSLYGTDCITECFIILDNTCSPGL